MQPRNKRRPYWVCSLALLVAAFLGCTPNNSETVLFNTTPLPASSRPQSTPSIRIDKNFGESPRFVDLLEIDKVVKLQLTDSSILAFVSDIAIIGDRILILDRKQIQLFMFSSDGEFIKQVGRAGEGPGEYIKAEFITSSESQFLVLDTDRRTIIYYDDVGNWVKNDNLSKTGIHPINDFLFINGRAYFPNPIYTLSKDVDLPVNLIYDIAEKKVLWGFEKRFPPFYKKNPPYLVQYTSFSRVEDKVWFGPPYTSEVFIYDLDGRFVKKIMPGIPKALSVDDYKNAENRDEFSRIRRAKYRNTNIFHVGPYVLTTYSGPFKSAPKRMSIFDVNGHNLAKNFKTKNAILFSQLLGTHGEHIIGVVIIDFFQKKAIDTFLTDQQKAKFVDVGWDENSSNDSEDNPYLVFFKVKL